MELGRKRWTRRNSWVVHHGTVTDVMLYKQTDVIASGSDALAALYVRKRNAGTR